MVFSGNTFEVTVGGVDRTTAETYEVTKVSKYGKYHEKYDEYWLSNDIAVIKLPQPFELSKSLKKTQLFNILNAFKKKILFKMCICTTLVVNPSCMFVFKI